MAKWWQKYDKIKRYREKKFVYSSVFVYYVDTFIWFCLFWLGSCFRCEHKTCNFCVYFSFPLSYFLSFLPTLPFFHRICQFIVFVFGLQVFRFLAYNNMLLHENAMSILIAWAVAVVVRSFVHLYVFSLCQKNWMNNNNQTNRRTSRKWRKMNDAKANWFSK